MLTIEELKSLKTYEWVWVDILGQKNKSTYVCIFKCNNETLIWLEGDNSYRLDFSDYGKTWLAFKNKEEAEGKSIPFDIFVKMWSDIEGDDLPCNLGFLNIMC